MNKYLKVLAIFEAPGQPDFEDLGLEIKVETITGYIYVNPNSISHYHEDSEGDTLIYIYDQKWSIKMKVDDFSKLINNE